MGLLGLVGPQSTLRGPNHQHRVSSISHLSKEFYYLQPKNGHGQLLPGGERCSSPFPLLVLIGHISAAMTPRPPQRGTTTPIMPRAATPTGGDGKAPRGLLGVVARTVTERR